MNSLKSYRKRAKDVDDAAENTSDTSADSELEIYLEMHNPTQQRTRLLQQPAKLDAQKVPQTSIQQTR